MPYFWKDWSWFSRSANTLISAGVKHAELRAVMVHASTGWQNYATYFYVPLLSSGDDVDNPRPQILGSLALMRKLVPVETLASYDDMIHAAASWEELGFSQIPPALAKDFQVYFYGSHNRFGSFPVWTFEFGGRPSSGPQQLPAGPFLHPGFPLYESVAEAATDWLGDPSIAQNSFPVYAYLCLLRSSTAIIEDLSIEEEGKLIVEIKPLGSLNGMYLKLVAKHPGDIFRLTQEAASKVIIDVPPELQRMTVYLIDEQGEPHDYFEETPSRSSWPKSIIGGGGLKARGELLDQIHQGEGVSLEFKEWLPTRKDEKKRHELLQTVVAFANTKGGVILVGIDDHGEIKGVERSLQKEYGEKLGGDIAQLLNAYQKDLRHAVSDEVNPDIELRFEKLDYGDQIVLAIYVSQGATPPYHILRSNDIYVRRGANNMKPTPDELRHLLERNTSLVQMDKGKTSRQHYS